MSMNVVLQPGSSSLSLNTNYIHRYLQYAASVLDSYRGNEPFHHHVKKYFSSNRKHGSRDRKVISSLCYNYFRLGFGVSKQTDFSEKVLMSSFLCGPGFSFLHNLYKPGWNDRLS